MSLHLNDLGGPDNCSEAEKAIARRAACLIVELEQMERKFAVQGEAKNWQLLAYQRGSNTMRRLLEAALRNGGRMDLAMDRNDAHFEIASLRLAQCVHGSRRRNEKLSA
jgi:hypothetical protein